MGDLLHTYRENFKMKIKKVRKDAGYTQKTLSEALGFSIETIKNWEQGRNIPEIEIICRLCDFFNCDINYLFTEMECKKNDDEFIHQETGLSEIAIRNIKYLNAYRKYNYKINIMNALLENDSFSLNIMNEISNYNFTHKKYQRQRQLDKEYEDVSNEYMKNHDEWFDLPDYVNSLPQFKDYDHLSTQDIKDKMDIELIRIEREFSKIVKFIIDTNAIPSEKYEALFDNTRKVSDLFEDPTEWSKEDADILQEYT